MGFNIRRELLVLMGRSMVFLILNFFFVDGLNAKVLGLIKEKKERITMEVPFVVWLFT